MQKRALVTGAGGFIGSHLVKFLKSKNYLVYGIDLKLPDFSKTLADEFFQVDLRDLAQSRVVWQKLSESGPIDELYMLAADMGGVAYIMSAAATLLRNNLLININSLELAKDFKIKKVFFASSACVYPQGKQANLAAPALQESDAIPADPDTFYGWEKLMTEQLCAAYSRDYGIEVRIARFHNIYGPEGTFQGGREKSPAALCRKIAQVKSGETIEIWGDGQQERSYCYIDDCCLGIEALMNSPHHQAINIGSDEQIKIDELVDLIAQIADKKITKKHFLNQAQGVRSRNADLTLARTLLNWQARTSLVQGLKKTYQWIEKQLKNH